MMPIGPMMIEHRLIERVIEVMKARLAAIQIQKKVDPVEVEKIIQFIKTYADACHHGKEENILFRELGRKKLSPEHKRQMEELVEDHKLGRKITKSLLEANGRYQKGDMGALSEIAAGLQSLVEFYPGHIEKEDRHFFIPVMDYFSPAEKEAMIREGFESDSRLLHEEHSTLVKSFETKKMTAPL